MMGPKSCQYAAPGLMLVGHLQQGRVFAEEAPMRRLGPRGNLDPRQAERFARTASFEHIGAGRP